MGQIFNNLNMFTKPIVLSGGISAGTSDTQTPGSVDMTGFDGVVFIALIGTVTSTGVIVLKAQQSTDNSTWNDIAGSHSVNVPTAGQILQLEIYKPQQRYVQPALVRTTANVVVQGVLAILYGPTFGPPALDTTVANFLKLNSPANGTA